MSNTKDEKKDPGSYPGMTIQGQDIQTDPQARIDQHTRPQRLPAPPFMLLSFYLHDTVVSHTFCKHVTWYLWSNLFLFQQVTSQHIRLLPIIAMLPTRKPSRSPQKPNLSPLFSRHSRSLGLNPAFALLWLRSHLSAPDSP